MLVSKRGKGLAIRLPMAVVEALGLKTGDEVDAHVVGARAFEIERRPTRRERLALLRHFRGLQPADFRFVLREAHGDRG